MSNTGNSVIGFSAMERKVISVKEESADTSSILFSFNCKLSIFDILERKDTSLTLLLSTSSHSRFEFPERGVISLSFTSPF